MSRALRAELARAFQEFDKDDDIKAIVLTGTGKAFTAGLDLKELGAAQMSARLQAPATAQPTSQSLRSCRKPVIGGLGPIAKPFTVDRLSSRQRARRGFSMTYILRHFSSRTLGIVRIRTASIPAFKDLCRDPVV